MKARRTRWSAGIVLGPHIDFTGLEGLEQGSGIAKIVDADLREIIAPARYRQVLGPPIGIQAIGQRATGVDAGNDVGSTADRCFQRRALKGFLVKSVTRK